MNINEITKEKLRAVLADAEWEGGYLVTQADWHRYLTWALDQLDAKDAALKRHAQGPLGSIKQAQRNRGNAMPR